MARCLRLKPLPMHAQCRSHGSRTTACRTRIRSCGARHTVSATTPRLWTTQMGRRGRSRNKTQSTEHRSGGKKGRDSGEEIDRVGLRSADQPASQPVNPRGTSELRVEQSFSQHHASAPRTPHQRASSAPNPTTQGRSRGRGDGRAVHRNRNRNRNKESTNTMHLNI